MSLPKYKPNQSGQILVIFLLVLVVGLALVLSIASRTVTDIRQTTTSDETNRAYFAAEAGVEKALRQIEETPGYGIGVSNDTAADVALAGVNRANANVEVEGLVAVEDVILNFDVDYNRDDVAQVSLIQNFNDLNSRTNPASIENNRTISIYWGDGRRGSSLPAYTATDAPAIEVSVIVFNSPTWQIYKMAFDPFAGQNGRPATFCAPSTSTPPAQGSFFNPAPNPAYRWGATITLNNPPCNSSLGGNNENDAVSLNNPIIARVKFLYADPVNFGVASNDEALPAQGYQIESTGETPSGVSRKLVVNRFYPALPALFDYALFDGSGNALCKPPGC